MKRYISLIIMLLFALNANAQLEVQKDSFKETPGFVIIDHDKTDVNNVPYAVVKVRTQNIDDKQRRELIFGSSLNVDIDLEYKVGEVWVYLTYEAEYLKISHPDFSSTEFWLPFDMEGGHGYEMTLVNKIQQVNTGYGTLKITTQPDGASISLNGKAMSQKTPYYNEMTAVGKYEIMISKDRYQTVLKTVKIVDNTEKSISERLIYDFANITVSSDSDVEIFIDGKLVGKGLWKGELQSGKHTVKCMRDYHLDVQQAIDVIAEKEAKYEIHPAPIFGVIDIMSEPTCANVFIDGNNCGKTPVTLNNIIIGPHKLKLEKNGCASVEKDITIDQSNTLIINEKLQHIREVSIITDRTGDQIYVDGNYIGVCPLTTTLTIGEHVIKAVRTTDSANETKSVQKTVIVSNGVGSLEVKMTVVQEIYDHEYVDLGLPSGLLWATCNVDAYNTEGHGCKYAWGEVETKHRFEWKTYKWCDCFLFLHPLNKYRGHGRKVLKMSDDVARIRWGGKWRMPTVSEWHELKDNCSWELTTHEGRYGYMVTSKTNGNSIYLPAGVDYWSSSLNTDDPDYAYELHLISSYVEIIREHRYDGNYVRPVSVPKFKINIVWLCVIIAMVLLIGGLIIYKRNGNKRNAELKRSYMEHINTSGNERKAGDVECQ